MYTVALLIIVIEQKQPNVHQLIIELLRPYNPYNELFQPYRGMVGPGEMAPRLRSLVALQTT